MRRIALLLALAALAGCSKGGTNPVVEEAWDELQGFWTDDSRADGASPPRAVTRADIQRAGVAAIWARLESDTAPTLLYATAENGPYVVFFSPFRQSITLLGSQITGTRGLGWDLLAAWSSPNDPLAHPTPPGQWPASIKRSYEFPADGAQGRIETYDCRIERGAAREMMILQQRHSGIEFSETCTGPSGSFENLHFADAGSGFVWRSLQWTGPNMELLDLQVVEPLD